MLAVDAVEGPEVHQHNLAFQGLVAQCRRVEPFHRAGQRGHGALGIAHGAVCLDLADQVIDDFRHGFQHAFLHTVDTFR
ncbi:hypothetical protein D3C72_1882430 [compost metagenome]